ncbi:MAG: transcription repressor NadR [Clostridia bacterium]|nr:transcription repressor NadR [Clostridia bacterium]
MNGEERRDKILSRLYESNMPVSANALASEFSVTRQIIVADIALLRAAGASISAKSRGYVLDGKDNGIIKRIAVKHTERELSDELYTIVDNGGRIIDVIVEHSVYGKISAELNLSSRYDVDEFMKKVRSTGASPLSILTEGFHIHTISVRDEDMFFRIKKRLLELGILIESD